jgi:hypothetical protein
MGRIRPVRDPGVVLVAPLAGVAWTPPLGRRLSLELAFGGPAGHGRGGTPARWRPPRRPAGSGSSGRGVAARVGCHGGPLHGGPRSVWNTSHAHCWSRPSRCATAVASPRPATPSLARSWETWRLAVFSVMNSAWPIYRLVRPSARSASTSASRPACGVARRPGVLRPAGSARRQSRRDRPAAPRPPRAAPRHRSGSDRPSSRDCSARARDSA